MHRPAALLLLFALTALSALAVPAFADGPALTARLGIGGRYKPGGWCLVTVRVTNPGPDPISGQVQVVLTDSDTGQGRFGRRSLRPDSSPAIFACPVSVPGGTAAPQAFSVYVRGLDPGQADLAVQLVEGRERGNGRVLARITTENPNQAAAFTGGPVSGADRLLVAFGGDPGAFSFLSGRTLPDAPQLQSFGGHFGGQSGAPATAQVAQAAAADLPDRAAGYGGVSAVLLRSDAPTDALTEAQSAALRSWVAGGGHLVVCAGSDTARFIAPFFADLLPATVGAGASGLPTLTPKPLPGVHAVPLPGGPAAVAGPYGAGTVTLTASDPPPGAPVLTAALPPVWSTLLGSRPPPSTLVLRRAATREEFGSNDFGDGRLRLSDTVIRGPSLDAPGTLVIGGFLLAYLVILVPVNYFVLKKMDRKEWAWGTIPALVLLFAAGTFAVGYAAKGGRVFVNRAALIETRAGRAEAAAVGEVGVFSPRRASYDIALPGANLAAAVPLPQFSGRGGDTPSAGGAQFVETPSGVSLPDTPVNMWAMRAFETRSPVNLGGAVTGTLAFQSGTLTGTLMNHTTYALSDAALLYNGHRIALGAFSPGAAVPVSEIAALGGNPPPDSLLAAPALTDSSDIHERMQAALSSYVGSLVQSDAQNSGQHGVPGFGTTPDEALLVGWSRDPALAGPPPKIDGRPATVNAVSLVIVHVPVSGAPAPVPAPRPKRRFALTVSSSLACRKALTASALGTGPASKITGKPVHILGIVTAVTGNPIVPSGAVLMLTQGGVPVVLPFAPDPNDPSIQGLRSREVLLTGVLARPKTPAGYPAIFVVSRPSQLQVVQ